MKKNLILVSMVFFASILHAQKKMSGWEVGSGFSVGTYLGSAAMTMMNTSINLEGEYHITKPFSVFGHIDYNRSYGTGEGTGNVGFTTTHIGPRYHINDMLFAGIGAGAFFYVDQSDRHIQFSYYPQVGVVFNKTELTFGYKGWTSNMQNKTGMLELGVVFKVHRVRER